MNRITAPQRREAAREDTFWAVAGIACLIALAVAFVVADGIARAFERPDGCRSLSAHECTAYHQERTPK